MTITLALLGSGREVDPVLAAARRFAELTASDLEAVLEPRSRGAESHVRALLEGSHVAMRFLEVGEALTDAVSDPGVLAAVVAAEKVGSRMYPLRSTVRSLLERTQKPIVVVPPDMKAPSTFRHLLIPLDGTEPSSRAVMDQLLPLCAKPVECTVLHVFTDSTLPSMLDRPARDLEILGREFLHRHLPHERHIEFRVGPIGQRVCEVSTQQGCDLVVLSWSQNTSPGRALVIQDVLNSTSLPVLLLPIP